MEEKKDIKPSQFRRVFSFLKKPWFIGIVILAGIGSYLYQQNLSSSTAAESTYIVSQDTLRDVLGLSGYIDAEEKVDLRFQTGGRLSWVGVKEGDVVKKYDGIASLDQRQVQKAIEKYLNLYDKQRRNFEQTHDNLEDDTVSLTREVRTAAERSLENAQFDLNNSVLDVEIQTIAKEYSFLYTPIDGIVTHVGAPASGMNVSITDIFQVINPETIYFSISVDQTEVVRLADGMSGIITLDAYPDEEIRGTITSISFTPKTNETGTVYEAKMALTPASFTEYRLGMTGDVEFILEEITNAISVPFTMLEEDENGDTFVYKQIDGQRQKVAVEVGQEYDGQVEILRGLTAGDVIYEIE